MYSTSDHPASSTTSKRLAGMWKTIPCFGKLTSQPSFSHAKMTPMLPPILPRTKLPTRTDHLQACRIVVGILNDAIIEPLNQCLMGIDAYHDCQIPVAAYQITDLHVISPFYTYNIASDGVNVNGSNVKEMSRKIVDERKMLARLGSHFCFTLAHP